MSALKTTVAAVHNELKESVQVFGKRVDDLHNQIDTTDTYIENYLPFRTLKEVTHLVEHCFDKKTLFAI